MENIAFYFKEVKKKCYCKHQHLFTKSGCPDMVCGNENQARLEGLSKIRG